MFQSCCVVNNDTVMAPMDIIAIASIIITSKFFFDIILDGVEVNDKEPLSKAGIGDGAVLVLVKVAATPKLKKKTSGRGKKLND